VSIRFIIRATTPNLGGVDVNDNIIIEPLRHKPVSEHICEFVERKGLGHPDYIIDSACEAASVALSKYYLQNFGKILHHNVDKGLLVGGRAIPRFGGGTVEVPIYILVAGRATVEVNSPTGKTRIPVEDIMMEAVKEFIKKNFRFLDAEKHVMIDFKVRQGSADLKAIVEASDEMPLANDTSFGVGYAPMTQLEKLVYECERMINSKDFKREIPASGEDCKVMGLRVGKKIRLTVADGIVSSLTHNVDEYKATKEAIREKVLDLASKYASDHDVEVYVNTADMFGKHPGEDVVYLTVTGTSAEAGDDGNTGRGNRVNGLITPNRQMSLEATAGKNPVSHVGKIYNVAAKLMAERIYEETKGVEEVYVKILSQIGKPIDKPQVVSVEYIPSDGCSENSLNYEITEIVKEGLRNIRDITRIVLEGKTTLF